MSKRLQELEKKYEELGEEIEKLKAEENNAKGWKPEYEESYWTVGSDGDIWHDTWLDVDEDEANYEMGNCFKTEVEGVAVVEKIKIYTELKRLAEEINIEPVDWKNKEQVKNYICYNHSFKKLVGVSIKAQQDMGIIYSTNRAFLDIAKKRIGEEKLLKLFKE